MGYEEIMGIYIRRSKNYTYYKTSGYISYISYGMHTYNTFFIILLFSCVYDGGS